METISCGNPKPLIQFGTEPLLHRTLRQLNEVGFTNITVVVGYRAEDVISAVNNYFPNTKIIINNKYKEDKNIYSLLCGFDGKDEPTLIIEGDVAFRDNSILDLYNVIYKNKSIWTVCGKFQPYQNGGIIKAQTNGKIEEITYAQYSPAFRSYYKNLGAIFCGPNEIRYFHQLLKEYTAHSLDEYFMMPWADHLAELPAEILDLGLSGGASFNTPEEYQHALIRLDAITNVQASTRCAKLVDVQQLRHIENFDPERVEWLCKKILTDRTWTSPIVIDDVNHLVMDGQHRLEVAIILGLKKIPAVCFNYAEVEVWSLRPNEYTVNIDEIISRALSGDIYPYKTAKHRFPEAILPCNFQLEILY